MHTSHYGVWKNVECQSQDHKKYEILLEQIRLCICVNIY